MTRSVLIVDDEEIIRALLSDWLELAGYETHAASDGFEGLRLLGEYRPNLVISDIMMPEMDGYEFCRLVRKSTNVPIMMITGCYMTKPFAGDDKEEVRRELGINDYMTKPFDMEEVLDRVDTMISWGTAGGASLNLEKMLTTNPLPHCLLKQKTSGAKSLK